MLKVSNRLIVNIIAHVIASITLILGAYITWEAIGYEDARLRNEIISNASIIERSVDERLIDSLACDTSDLKNPNYIAIKKRIKYIQEGYKYIRFIYVIAKGANDSIYINVDSENPNSELYSYPGQKYTEADTAFYRALNKNEKVTIGPYSDRWGTWVTAIVPFTDSIASNSPHLLCVDTAANQWNEKLMRAALMPIIITILFFIIIVVIATWVKRTYIEKENLLRISDSLSISETKYRKIFENVQDVFFQIDAKGLIAEMSPSIIRYSGYTREELIGTVMANYYYDPNERAVFLAELQQKSELSDYAIKMKRKNGEVIYASVNAHILFNDQKEFIGIEGSIRDISERKEMEDLLRFKNEELSTLNAMKDKFFSIIAHDIKNPFNHIIGFTSLLNKNALIYPPEQIKNFSTIIHESSLATYELLEELLTWSKSQSGQLKINPEVVDLSELIDKTLGKYSYFALNKKIEVKTQLKHKSQIFADSPTIQTVIRNLLNNAIKYTYENGCVVISTSEDEKFITVSIADNGVGLEKEDLNSLFRIDASTMAIGTGGEKGTGLGLILCKEFVEKNGGTIGVTSEIGKGSCFYFTVTKAL